MKKVLLMLVAGAFISMSMVSCKKDCGRCTSAGAKLCKGDAGYDLYKSNCGSNWVSE
jgi:hypothetical protein